MASLALCDVCSSRSALFKIVGAGHEYYSLFCPSCDTGNEFLDRFEVSMDAFVAGCYLLGVSPQFR